MKKQIFIPLLALSLFALNGFTKEPTGFKFSEINPGGLYDKLGLKNGDILLKLNNGVVKDIGALKNAFQGLKRKGDSLKLEVYRNGKTETFNYNFK